MENCEGIVLKSIKYSDNQLIVQILTKEHGRISTIVGRKRKKGTSNYFQSLYHISFKMMMNKAGSIHRISDVQFCKPYHSIPFDVYKTTIAQFIAEIVGQSVPENDIDPGLFDFIVQSLHFFDNVEENYTHFHLFFLARLLTFLGFSPLATKGSFFSPTTGQFSEQINHDTPPKDVVHLFNTIIQTNISSFTNIEIERKNQKVLLQLLIDVFKHHANIDELKSYKTLKTVFG